MDICIIKLGAAGDVVRTLHILPAIKEKYPNSKITWITKPEVSELLEGNPYINKIVTLNYQDIEKNEYDIVYNFDIEEDATNLAVKIKAKKKYGFYSENGYAASFNSGAEYYLNTIFDDQLKKKNKKTYQEMMFMAAELPYDKDKYFCGIYLNEKDRKYAEDFVKNNKIETEKLIGIHMGAASRWPSKVWHPDRVKEFIKRAKNEGYNVLLFGGPNEVEAHRKLAEELKKEGIDIYQNKPSNTKKEFASLVNLCKVMICSDSLSLHVALSLKKETIGLFFCTSPDEVEGYKYLKKIISPMLYDFFPERSDEYSEELVKSISADIVLKEIKI